MRHAIAAVAATIALCGTAQAGVVRLDVDDFRPSAGQITFSEFAVGTEAPTYDPADYGGDENSPTVSFSGFFQGQGFSDDPSVDCPGGAATGCVVGTPTGPLGLDSGSPQPFITTDSANPTSPVLSGTPRFNGAIAVLFSTDQVAVGFDAGFFDDIGGIAITAFDRDGNLIGSFANETEGGIEFLGLAATGGDMIAGVLFSVVGGEQNGFAIDNLRFGMQGDVIVDDVVPVPGAMILFATGVAAGWARKRKLA